MLYRSWSPKILRNADGVVCWLVFEYASGYLIFKVVQRVIVLVSVDE